MYSKSVVKLNDKITVYWKLRPVKSCIFGSGNIFSAAKIYTQMCSAVEVQLGHREKLYFL